MSVPARERIEARLDQNSSPAIARLRKILSSGKDAEDAYLKWRKDPCTVMFVRALQELADSPPLYADKSTDPNHIILQYGMTSGLDLACRLILQPNRVYPEIFRGTARASDPDLDEAYVDTPDSVIDKM